jgi:Leu/Phe-tRNA-protein transferase
MRITKIEASYLIEGLNLLLDELLTKKHFDGLGKREAERMAFLKKLRQKLKEEENENRTGSRKKELYESYHDAMVKRYLR